MTVLELLFCTSVYCIALVWSLHLGLFIISAASALLLILTLLSAGGFLG